MRRLLTLTLASAFVVALGAAPASAWTGFEATDHEVECDAFLVSFTASVATRNTTGTGSERYLRVITDGNGVVLYEFEGSAFVNTGFVGADLLPFEFTTAPTANPIRFLHTSPAGNGFDTQVLWDLSGDSPCLAPSGGVVPEPPAPPAPAIDEAPPSPAVATPRFTG